jgi:hypothetical protein
MRKYLLAVAAMCAVAGVAVPVAAAHDAAAPTTKPTGEHCVQRVQSSDLSDAGKAIAEAACIKRASAIAEARAAFRAARMSYREKAKAAREAFREAVEAAASKPEAEREAAIEAALAVRKATIKAARVERRAARNARDEAVEAARLAFKAAMEQARAA